MSIGAGVRAGQGQGKARRYAGKGVWDGLGEVTAIEGTGKRMGWEEGEEVAASTVRNSWQGEEAGERKDWSCQEEEWAREATEWDSEGGKYQ